MNIKHIHLPLVLAACMFSGCSSPPEGAVDEPLSEREQKAVLADHQPPQNFGFSVYPAGRGIGFQGVARLHPGHAATARFVKDGIPVIEMRGRSPRDRINVLLDTGSAVSWMNFSTAEKLEVQFMGVNDKVIPYRGGFNIGGVNAFAGVVSQLRIDQLFMENVPLYVRMAEDSLGPPARGITSPDVDAVCGYDVLGQFEFVQVDVANGTVVFSSSTPYLPSEDRLMSATKIAALPGYGLAVSGALYGDPAPVVLDLAGDYHFARSDAETGTTKQVSLGDVVYRQVPTIRLSGGSPSRAGRRMLEKYIITICPRLGLVYFELPVTAPSAGR